MTSDIHSQSRYGSSFRLWHWLNAIAMFGILGTVLLRKTFLSWRTNAAVIQDSLASYNISFDEAAVLAKTIRTPMWEWHYIFGFALVALIIIRLVQIAMRRDIHNFFPTDSLTRLKMSLYVIFYAALVFMAISGVMLFFKGELGLSKSLSGTIKDLHEMAMWIFVGFTALHLVGVVMDELIKRSSIVSKMIHGHPVKTL